ncbi:MAG: DUF58 domain-containing protein [Elusimicrobia bacterium]|nr:DUF58 domain-containing protein [Elusimicrobiota bacterium]
MLSAELIAKVRRLEITSAKLVQEIFAGQYTSVFKGHGLEFSDIREYQWGDDIRAMHWKALARSGGEAFIKRFVEERQLTVMMAVDISGSQNFGSNRSSKREVVQDVAGLLTYMAMKNKDRAGLLMFTDRTELYLPARSGRGHALRILRELVACQPQSTQTDLKSAVRFLLQMTKKRSIVFLISDFLADIPEIELAILGKKHDVVAVTIEDPAERRLPALAARVRLQDAERPGFIRELDLRHQDDLDFLSRETQKKREALSAFLRRAGIDQLDLQTGKNFTDALAAFFRKRQEKNRR